MAKADGTVTLEEIRVLAMESVWLNIPKERMDQLITESANMNQGDAISIVSTMSSEQKKHVSAFLAAVLFADKIPHPDEMKLWTFVCNMASIPYNY